MIFIPELERQPLEVQKKWQSVALQKHLEYIQHRSPFYQKMFKENNINIEKIKSIDDLHLIPVTTKQQMQLYNWDFLCVPPTSIREFAATSGTLGKPVTIALTKKDLHRLSYNEYLSLCCMGAKKGDIFQLMLTLDRQFMAGMAYYSGIMRLGGIAVRTGPGFPQMQWESILNLKVNNLIVVPSFLLKVLELGTQINTNNKNIPLKKALLIGESIRDADLKPNAMAQRIRSLCDIELHGTYASTEMQTAFTECSAGMGGHQHPELIIVELIDEEGQPVSNGEAGEVCVTPLGIEGMPLLRYCTGDICKAYYEPIGERKTMRLGPVLGRKNQMIKLKGTTVYPLAVINLLNECKEVKEYFIEISCNANKQDHLKIYLSTSYEEKFIKEKLLFLFKQQLKVMPELTLAVDEFIQGKLFTGEQRKVNRIIDLRK